MAYTYDYPRAAITTDAVIARKISENEIQVLLIQRLNQPFQGMWALPGGFLDMDETLEQCVVRELREETGLEGIDFTQAGAYSAIDRDPRHRTITVAFFGWAGDDALPRPGSDSGKVQWFNINDLPPLAFDHHQIIANTIRDLAKI